MLTMCVSN